MTLGDGEDREADTVARPTDGLRRHLAPARNMRRARRALSSVTGWPPRGAVSRNWRARVKPVDAGIPKAPETQQMKFALFAQTFDWFLAQLPVPPRSRWTVLEAGQGSTGFSHFYRQLFDQVYGVDLSDYSAFHPGVETIVADLTEGIPLPEQSIDLVVSHSVLEHVRDVPAVLASMDRVLKLGGYAFLTVSPLYFSAEGAHMKVGDHPYLKWEHLDPLSASHLVESPPHMRHAGAFLNKCRPADYLRALGTVPWDIVSLRWAYDRREVPEFVDRVKFSELELRTRGFKCLARKAFHLETG